MSNREILEQLRDKLESSMMEKELLRAINIAIELENYQMAADFKQQQVGKLFAIALIEQELENLADE